MTKNLETATLANGCFWCTEAVFQRLKGVESVKPGYSGGKLKKPSYEEVSTGTTGHAEAIQIEFDPKVISYDTILEVFFATHDPTTLNRQGNDVGEQYRSAIFYQNEEQKKSAFAAIDKAQKDHKDKIVTEVVPLKEFFEAEDYHKNYYNNNKDKNPYCSVVIGPKIHKLMEKYGDMVK